MASFGDQYNYQVVFDASGIGDLDQSAAALGRLGKSAKKAADDTKQSGAEIAAAGQRIGMGLTQAAFVFDDLSFGARALRNQILPLSTSLLGYGVAGAAVGAAGTVLVGVFGEQIDRALAYAGILDENLVKGMERAEGKTEEYKETLDLLKGALDDATEAQEKFIGALKAEDLSESSLDAALRQIVAQQEPLGAAIGDAQEKVKSLAEELAGLQAMAAGGGDFGGAIAGVADQLEEARDAVAQLQKEAGERIDAGVGKLKEELQKGAEAAEKVLERLEALPNKGADAQKAIEAIRGALDKIEVDKIAESMEKRRKAAQETKEFADAILQQEKDLQQAQNERFAAAEEERQKEVKAILDQMALEQKAEDERKARVNQRRLEEAQARAREQLDEGTRRAVETFGPVLQQLIAQSLQSSLRLGASPQQARTGAFRGASDFLERFGLGRDVAAGAAMQLVDEQAAPMRAAVDANNAAAQFARMQLQNTGFLLNAFNQSRAEFLQMMRAAEIQRRQIQANTRRFQPLRFLGGHPLGGFF